jgi:hypothetical protein
MTGNLTGRIGHCFELVAVRIANEGAVEAIDHFAILGSEGDVAAISDSHCRSGNRYR